MDVRDMAQSLRWWNSLDGLTAYLTLRDCVDDEGEPTLMSIPIVMEVCTTCRGRGSYTNPNIDRNGLSREDFEEDLDFAEDYFSGVFHIRCEHCQGTNVTPWPISKEHIRLVESILDGRYYAYAEQEAERRMGA